MQFICILCVYLDSLCQIKCRFLPLELNTCLTTFSMLCMNYLAKGKPSLNISSHKSATATASGLSWFQSSHRVLEPFCRVLLPFGHQSIVEVSTLMLGDEGPALGRCSSSFPWGKLGKPSGLVHGRGSVMVKEEGINTNCCHKVGDKLLSETLLAFGP